MKVWLKVAGVTDWAGYIVDAEPIDDTPYAVHLHPSRDCWTVTHVPTGQSVGKGFRNKSIAIAYARELDDLMDDSFETDKPIEPPNSLGVVEMRNGYVLS